MMTQQNNEDSSFIIACGKCGCSTVRIVHTIYNEVVLKCENKDCGNREVIMTT